MSADNSSNASGGASSMPSSAVPDPRMPRLTQSPGFLAEIGKGWGETDRAPRFVAGNAEAAASHRQRLREIFPNTRLLIAAGTAPARANDTYYDFRADSDYLWLTGAPIEGAIVELGSEGTDTLYFPPPAKPGESGFFANAIHGELWVGPQPGLREVADALDLETKPISEFELWSEDPLVAGTTAGTALSEVQCSPPLQQALAELRMIKDEWELQELRTAILRTEEGFEATIREIPPALNGLGERWLQGTFDRYAKLHGNGPGYSSIVGAGANAPILHWTRAEGQIRDGDLLLLDMGVETFSGYTADVTRTIPVNGTFSRTQREVYELVERAHRAGLAAVQPGKPWSDFHVACMEVIAQGLHEWGLLKVSVDEALSPDGQQHRRYLVCGVGHHLGLDVHDCASAKYEHYQGATLQPAMALTVEPGLYFHAFDETVPPELRGIGVRIEDDVFVTEHGHEVISSSIPISANGIEQWTQALIH